MQAIESGTKVRVRDAYGVWLERRAASGIDPGHDFPVIWAAREDEWQAALEEGRQPNVTPWPAEDVVLDFANPS